MLRIKIKHVAGYELRVSSYLGLMSCSSFSGLLGCFGVHSNELIGAGVLLLKEQRIKDE